MSVLDIFKTPKILDNNETIDKIINNRSSVGRFGDGEFFY